MSPEVDSTERELVVAWLAEYCSPAPDDPAGGPTRRVDIHAGASRSLSRARKAVNGVVIPRSGANPDQIAGTLLRRISLPRADGHRYVWLVIMETGSHHPVDALQLDGDPRSSAADEIDGEDGEKAGTSLASSKGFLALIADNREMRRELRDAYAAGVAAMVQVARYETAEASLDERQALEQRAVIAEQVQKSITQVAPYLPQIVEAVMGNKPAASNLPPEPTPKETDPKPDAPPPVPGDAINAAGAIVEAVDRLDSIVSSLRASGSWDPETEERVRAIVTPAVLRLISAKK